jgi:alanine-glyoxylate transaminase/serine-glyoxylate transaminase/serine-pyruvate transaminase
VRQAGRHFLQIPGPSAVPDRIMRAIDMPVIDHRGPSFAVLGLEVLNGMKTIFKTSGPVIIYPASGTGAWEAALVNALSSGDKVLMIETGHFASMWKKLAEKVGLQPELIETDWRRGADPDLIETRLRADAGHEIKAVCVVHNETSTGATSRIHDIRKAIDAAGHPALFMVDTISGLASADFRFEEWGVDVAISGSQKGLMLPPGISFNAVSEKAIAAAKAGGLPNSYWGWEEMIAANKTGYFPYTPATNLLFGLAEAIKMLNEEGLENVFARHHRHGEATRRAVQAWGLEVQCLEPSETSPVLTAVRVPDGSNSDELRAVILKNFDMSLGNGLSKVQSKVFRIGHLGDFNDLMLAATLSGVEMGLELAGVPHQSGGVARALDYLKSTAGDNAQSAAAE